MVQHPEVLSSRIGSSQGDRDYPVALTGVSRSYGSIRALSGVTLELPRGVTVLLGRNGAGKSTLSRVVAGVEQPDAGQMLRDGKPVAGHAGRRDHLARTGWLPQAFSAPSSMTVTQYIAYAAWLKNLDRRATGRAVEAALASADLTDLRSRRLDQLSGGMLRRVGIAAAVVQQPDLLVLDEPTAGLDPEQRGLFHDLVRGLAADRAVLLSTHLLEDVAAMGDHTVVLDKGLIRFRGTMDALMALGTGDDVAARLRSGFLATVATADPA